MWIAPLKERLSPDQWAAWQDIQHAALELVRQGDRDDPWVFHGSSAIRAGFVLQEGFEARYLFGSLPHEMPLHEGVYWGHPTIAASYAYGHADSDNLPVLFVARASDVARSTPDGILRPDYFACEEAGCPRLYPDGMNHESPELPTYQLGQLGDSSALPPNMEGGLTPATWQQSLMVSGAVTAPGGRHVPNLALLSIPADLPHHPEAGRKRAYRLQAGEAISNGLEMSLDPRDAAGAREALDGMQLLQHPSQAVGVTPGV